MLNPNNGGAWFRCFSFLWLDGTKKGRAKFFKDFRIGPKSLPPIDIFAEISQCLEELLFFSGGEGTPLAASTFSRLFQCCSYFDH